jgi:membrane-bound ClpP family serine protease
MGKNTKAAEIMNDRGQISTLKAWLLVLVSLVDEAVFLVLAFLALRYFRVDITWPVILVVVLAAVIFLFVINKAVIPAMRRRKTTGADGMVGLTVSVTGALTPGGTIKINDEYWQAKSLDGDINAGEEVEVVGISGLTLEVKRKTS